MLQAPKQYIPIPSGQSFFIQEQGLISNLLGIPGYELLGDGYIIFTEDLTIMTPPIKSVDIQLAVMDFDKYSDFDILPLTADHAGEIVRDVFALLMPTPPADKRVDSVIDEIPQKR